MPKNTCSKFYQITGNLANSLSSRQAHTQQATQGLEGLMQQLLPSSALKGWERLFIATVEKCPKPSLRQLQKVRAFPERQGLIEAEGGAK